MPSPAFQRVLSMARSGKGVPLKSLMTLVVGALLLGGCAVYAEPVPSHAGVYVGPPVVVGSPVVVAPGPVW